MTAIGLDGPRASTIEEGLPEGEPALPLPARVAHVVARLTHQEPESFALDLVAAGERYGVAGGIVFGGGPLAATLAAREVPHEVMQLDTAGTLAFRANVARLAKLVRRQHVDVVHAHGTAAIGAVPAARRARTPVVVSLYRLPRDGQLRRRLFTAASQAGAVLAATGAIASALADGGVPQDRITVVPAGIDLMRFHPAQIAPNRMIRLAHRWHLPDHAPVALLPTALVPGEGHDVVIAALALLDERPLHLVLLGEPGGDPDHVRQVLRLADERGVGHRLCVVEAWEELPTAALLAEMLIVASPRLDFAEEALAVAQATGRPAVALDHPGVEVLPSAGALTWLAPPDSPEALAHAVRAALDLPEEERAELVPSVMESVRAHYDRTLSCDAVLEIYRRLLDRGARAAVREAMPASEDVLPEE